MNIIERHDEINGRTLIYLEILDYEVCLAPLNSFDLALAKECGQSGSISDKLLWLETLARKIESASPNRAEKDSK